MICFGIDARDKKSTYHAIDNCGERVGTTRFPTTKKQIPNTLEAWNPPALPLNPVPIVTRLAICLNPSGIRSLFQIHVEYA